MLNVAKSISFLHLPLPKIWPSIFSHCLVHEGYRRLSESKWIISKSNFMTMTKLPSEQKII